MGGGSKFTIAPGTPPHPCIAGMAVLDLRAAIESLVGVDTVRSALDTVSTPARDEYLGAHAKSWVSYATLTEIHEAIARRAGTTADDLVKKAVPLAIERSFKTVWRVFLRFTTDDALISRTPAIYARSRNMGTMTARLVARGLGESVVSGWSEIPDRDIASLRVSIATFLTLAGRADVKVAADRTADGARFSVRWK